MQGERRKKKGNNNKRNINFDDFNRIKLNIPKQELSFCVTENCNLNCSYCYLPRKNTNRKMSFEIAKRAIDYFLNRNDYFSAPSLIIDFIGGEPLIEAELIDQISDYFKIEAYRLNHPWFNNYKFNFSTNGTLYLNKKVQKFIDKNINCLYPSISLDGIKEKHDNARKYKNGRGSYNNVVKSAKRMLEQISQTTIKATFGHGDIKYFKDSVVHFIELGFPIENIYANVVYEDLWDIDDDLLFEEQLKELADYLIDNDLCSNDYYGTIFSKAIGKPYTDEHLSKHWCNTGHGIIVSVDGAFYPCIRFLEMAFTANKVARKIGDVQRGIYFDKLRPFRVLTLENCSPKKCLECQIASGCNMCSGQALSESSLKTIFNRPTHICKMHKARVRANNYFFKKLAKKENVTLNKNDYLRNLRIIKKKILNVQLSDDSPSICNYSSSDTRKIKGNQVLPIDVLNKYLKIAKEMNYYINFILPNHEIDEKYKSIISNEKFQVTKPYKNESNKWKLQDGYVFIFDVGQSISPGFSCANVILHMGIKKLSHLLKYVKKLLSHNVIRINLIIDDLNDWNYEDILVYKVILSKISDLIFNLYKKGQQKSINVLTDRLMLEKMNNCNAGLEHVTLGPDGNIYLCPAFYYKNLPIEQNDNILMPSGSITNLLKIENAPICMKCDAYQCKRCIYYNLISTEELNIPGERQCVISHVEREVSKSFQDRLIKDELIPYPNRNIIVPLNYQDPFEIARVW